MSPRFLAPAFAGLLLWALVWAGCNAGERSLAEVDPEAAPLNPTYEQVTAILERHCVPCHRDDKPSGGRLPLAGDDGDEDDEDEFDDTDPDYDSCKKIQRGLGRLFSILDEDTMPPGARPRLSERDKQTIRNWINNGACSPCTTPCAEGAP